MMARMKITSVNSSSYQLKIADIDGNNIHDFTVSKDKNKAHVYFSFENKGTYLNLEPNIDNWHISFLRYRWIYYQFNPPLLYTVTGIYINNKRVKAAVDSTMKLILKIRKSKSSLVRKLSTRRF